MENNGCVQPGNYFLLQRISHAIIFRSIFKEELTLYLIHTMKKILAILVILCTVAMITAFIQQIREDDPVPIAPSKQRMNGNAQAGFEYLINGDYVKGGIPYKLFLARFGKNDLNFLNRHSVNKVLSYDFTAIQAGNGEILVAPNCLQCHAQVFDGKLVLGLGNSSMDFSDDAASNVKQVNKALLFLKTFQPKKYEASKNFFEITKTISPYLQTGVQGVNSADRLAAVLAAHRDPVTFKWNDIPQLDIPEEIIPTDTPPWWLLKKKNAMFYNGFGRGDFGRFLMASNLLTVKDTSESQQVDRHMPDLLAYIYSIEPPKYPKPIDASLATEGKIVFENNCSRCHGSYGENKTYPNLLI
ncbi:MAG: hypothetical protein M3O67_01070, partial [Bacteroidota bacterium]|nr:hypothetical protein [Bacteroidota bacterium]